MSNTFSAVYPARARNSSILIPSSDTTSFVYSSSPVSVLFGTVGPAAGAGVGISGDGSAECSVLSTETPHDAIKTTSTAATMSPVNSFFRIKILLQSFFYVKGIYFHTLQNSSADDNIITEDSDGGSVMQSFLTFDGNVSLLFQNSIRNPVTDPIMLVFSLAATGGIIWFVIIAILLAIKKTRRAGLYVLLCLVLSWVVSELVIKPIVMRPRPFVSIDGLTVLYARFADASSFSFPSSHSCTAFASAYALTRKTKYGWCAYIFAFFAALSRLYIGVHYLSDIVCGATLGTAASALICFAADRITAARARDRGR